MYELGRKRPGLWHVSAPRSTKVVGVTLASPAICPEMCWKRLSSIWIGLKMQNSHQARPADRNCRHWSNHGLWNHQQIDGTRWTRSLSLSDLWNNLKSLRDNKEECADFKQSSWMKLFSFRGYGGNMCSVVPSPTTSSVDSGNVVTSPIWSTWAWLPEIILANELEIACKYLPPNNSINLLQQNPAFFQLSGDVLVDTHLEHF